MAKKDPYSKQPDLQDILELCERIQVELERVRDILAREMYQNQEWRRTVRDDEWDHCA